LKIAQSDEYYSQFFISPLQSTHEASTEANLFASAEQEGERRSQFGEEAGSEEK
jgi:hypothetical protein